MSVGTFIRAWRGWWRGGEECSTGVTFNIMFPGLLLLLIVSVVSSYSTAIAININSTCVYKLRRLVSCAVNDVCMYVCTCVSVYTPTLYRLEDNDQDTVDLRAELQREQSVSRKNYYHIA